MVRDWLRQKHGNQIMSNLVKEFVQENWNQNSHIFNVRVVQISAHKPDVLHVVKSSIRFHAHFGWRRPSELKANLTLAVQEQKKGRATVQLRTLNGKQMRGQHQLLSRRSLQHVLGWNMTAYDALMNLKSCSVCMTIMTRCRVCEGCFGARNRRRIYYCSKKCQKKGWKLHSAVCGGYRRVRE